VTGFIDQITVEHEKSGPMDEYVTTNANSKLVISDTKTRVHTSIPSARTSRAAEMQLSLYHQLLSAMIDGTVEIARLFSHLALDVDAVFSDAFLVEIADVYICKIDISDILAGNTLNVHRT
jgi:Exonuclease V - a 5' deoxyribonuclease